MALDRDIALLAQVPILSLFDSDALRLLAFSAETRILRAGDVLFREGEQADGGYLIVSGSVGLDGREDGDAVEHVVGPGALIGEMALFTTTTRPATAIARESSTTMLITRRAMARLLQESPETAQRIHHEISRRVLAVTGELSVVGKTLMALNGETGR